MFRQLRPRLAGSWLGVSRLTAGGRLKSEWEQARSEIQPTTASLERMREIRDEMRADPDTWTYCWLDLARDLVAPAHVALLTDEDFAALEDMERVLADFEQAPVAELGALTAEARTARAVSLARRGADGDRELAIFAAHVRSAADSPSAEVVAAVQAALDVDLTSDPRRRARAARLVDELGPATLLTALTLRVRGIRSLTERRDPAAAVVELQRAARADPGDARTRGSLAAARLAAGDPAGALDDLSAAGPDVLGLRPLATAVRWLDDVVAAGDRPGVSSGDLLSTAPPACLVDVRDAAAGRLALIDGDADTAERLLSALADRCPEQPRWAYHAAWAQLLHHGHARVEVPASWPAGWTLASLLGEAARPAVPPAQERGRVLAARLALGEGRQPRSFQWRTGSAGPEEELEAVRVIIATELRERRAPGARRALDSAPFARLPLADRSHWQGLLALAEQRSDEAVVLLDKACGLGAPHAPVALCAHHLQIGAIEPARALLRTRLAQREEPHVALLRARAEIVEGHQAAAEETLRRLLGRRIARAGYALADLHATSALHAAQAGDVGRATNLWQQAAAAAATAVDHAARDAQSLPPDAETLVSTLAFAADPTCPGRALQLRVPQADRARRAWVAWHGAIAELWTEPLPQALVAAHDAVCAIETATGRQGPSPAIAVSHQISKLALQQGGGDHRGAEQALALLDRLAVSTGSQEIVRMRRLVGSGGRRDRLSAPIAARAALAAGDRVRAAALLAAEHDDADVARVCALLITALTAEAAPAGTPDGGADRAFETVSELVLQSLAAYAVGDGALGASRLVQALRQDGERVHGIVRVDAMLDQLCAAAAGAGPAVPGLIETVEAQARGSSHPPTVIAAARCAAALGARTIALDAFTRASRLDGRDRALAREHAGYLCHLAADAARRGDELAAAEQLELAATVAPTGPS